LKAQLNDETGATMAEAAIAISILILFIGGVIDFGLGLYQYNFLNYTTTRAARNISAKLSVSGACGEISAHLRDVAYKEMVQAMSSAEPTTWSWTMPVRGKAGSKDLYNFQLTGRLPLNCYFICTVVPKNWTITTTVTAAVDSPDVYCADGSWPNSV
jgi:Flp pilus assembly protein TadG